MSDTITLPRPCDEGLDDDTEELDLCPRCHGDGRDPWFDYLLPCPECQGEQRP